jgi:hypothetical protein
MAIIRYKRTTDDNSCYKIGKMILTSLNAKSVFIFSTLAGVVLATNNLRELRTHNKNDDLHTVESLPSYQGPTITLDKDAYAEGEDITVTFSVGAPTDKFYNSVDAPSLDLDFDYPKWKIGLFMRDADPQGGSLEPIVSINLCGAMDCDADNLNYEDYASSVTFGDEYESLMQGVWPVKMNDYGTGLDAYVLDADGAAAIGPFEFELFDKENENDSSVTETKTKSSTLVKENSTPKPPSKPMSALAKYSRADMKDTGIKRKHMNKAATTAAKLHDGNGLMSSLNVPSNTNHSKDTKVTQGFTEKNVIKAEKKEYQEDEPITITYSLDDEFKNVDKSKWTVGIFTSQIQPHGGTVEAIASIPISDGVGQVTFGRHTTEAIKGSWPMNFIYWGHDFHAYVLDDNGATILGPSSIFSVVTGM